MRNELKKARNSKSATQQDVADYLNIAQNHYQRIEYDKSDTSSDNWLKLFEFFEKAVPLDKLMANTPKSNTT